MIDKCLASVLCLFFILSACVFAQDEDLQSTVSYKVNKMKKELNLTDSQVDAINPIIKNYLVKKGEILQGIEGQGIIDHVAVKSTLKALKDKEYQQLSRILSEEQLQQWSNKENLMATLNPDSTESSVDDGPTMTANGANFKF